MLHVLRPIVAIWRVLNQERDRRIAESAARRERLKMQKEMQAQMRPVFGEKPPVYVPVAILRPEQQTGAYEFPQKQTGPIQRTRPLPPVTTSLPAVGPDGYYLHPGEKARRFWQQQRRAGK